VLACRRRLNDADVVFSTVDTVGIPLTLLAGRGLVRTPIVYAAIGLPERLAQLRSQRAQRAFLVAYRRLHTIVAYGAGEVDALRDWLGEGGPSVVFVPFGVDATYFAPRPDAVADTDVVSIGADPRRDYALFLALARGRPEWSCRLVLAGDTARQRARPAKRFDRDRRRSTGSASGSPARVVVLPVRDNSYSGATILLQAMATARPVVVTRTAAIATDTTSRTAPTAACSTCEPRGAGGGRQRRSLDDDRAASLGLRARETSSAT
jgi:hypothetical protein